MGAFSIFSGKKKKIKQDSGMHYRRLSTITMISKLICLLLLLVTVLWGFSFHTDEINMDNFKYLANALTDDGVQTDTYSTLYYDSNEHNRFALVRGDLGVVNSNGCTVYGLAGQRKSADSTLKMDNPQVISSAKYMYIYDLGGTELVIKNTVETEKTLHYNYAIRAAAVTDDGYIAVVSSEKTTRSTIFVYDEKYREIYKRSYGNQYALAVDLDDEESKAVVASVYTEDGAFITELGLYSLTHENPIATLSFEGEYPYKAVFDREGGIMLVTDKGCRFFDSNGKLLSFEKFGLAGIDSYYINSDGFIRMYSTATMSAEEMLELYGKGGELLVSQSFEKGVRLARCCDGYLFAVSDGVLYITRTEDGEQKTVETASDVIELLPLENDTLLILTHGTGSALDFGVLFETETEESEE